MQLNMELREKKEPACEWEVTEPWNMYQMKPAKTQRNAEKSGKWEEGCVCDQVV